VQVPGGLGDPHIVAVLVVHLNVTAGHVHPVEGRRARELIDLSRAHSNSSGFIAG
jgi:hypothetical protein